MPKKVAFIPNEKHLRIAWRLKRKKGTIRHICDRLKISLWSYNKHKQVFKLYFLQRADEDRRKFNRKNFGITGPCYKKGEKKFTPDKVDLDILTAYVMCGFTREKIAYLFGMSRDTLLHLMKKDKEIERILTSGTELMAGKIIKNGLLHLCKTHKVPALHHASYQGQIYSQEYDKIIEPNLGAVEFALTNMVGFSSKPKTNTADNRGSIMQMMDDIANGKTDEKK